MGRRAVIAICGCLYVAGSAWLVTIEGQSYRTKLRAARLAVSETGRALGDPPTASKLARARPAEEKPVPKDRPQPLEDPGPESKLSNPSSASELAVRSPVPPSAAAESPAHASVRVPPPPPRSPVKASESARRFEELDAFWKQPRITRDWTVGPLSKDDESELGRELNALIMGFNPPDNGPGLSRIKEAATSLLQPLGKKETDFIFTILNSDIPNAFSHPGGYIYISRKLLDMIPREEPSGLEFVVGHEIAHLDLQHALKSVYDPGVRRFADGTLAKFYFLILPHAFPDGYEFDADAKVYRWMRALGRSNLDCFAFLRKLEFYAKTHNLEDRRGKLDELMKTGRSKSGSGNPISPIENHLRAHTPASERLRRLRALRDQVEKAPK